MAHIIEIKQKGKFDKTNNFLKRMREKRYLEGLEKYGEAGVLALSSATPVDSGKTAGSWSYFIEKIDDGYRIVWTNDNVVDNWCVVALMIQYGHGTGSGAYVEGVDYINPALHDIFEALAENAWREVTK